jgi:hypothetical protein
MALLASDEARLLKAQQRLSVVRKPSPRQASLREFGRRAAGPTRDQD